MPSKLLPLATLGLLMVAPVFVSAAPQAAITLRARTTVSHDELATNTAKGLATPIGIASSANRACELRCVLANPDTTAPNSDTLLCAFGEVRTVERGFEVRATWSDEGVELQPANALDLSSCP